MQRVLSVEAESFPIAGTFTISRGSKTEAKVLTCTIREGGHLGRGECVPYARYGETLDSVRDQIEAARVEIERGIGRTDLLGAMRAGAARNAVDCALWDLDCKLSGRRAYDLASMAELQPLLTAVTISLGPAEAMAAQVRANPWPLIKVKVGTDDDGPRIRAIAAAAPQSRIILDANEGWSDATVRENLAIAAECGIALIEQPLPAGKDALLGAIPHPVPLCADESVHTLDGLAALVGRYDVVNIKLDKTGGLTAALALRDEARRLGFGVMVGCMVGTSLAMAPAVLLAQGAEFVDLDGPLLLARDRTPGLHYQGSTVFPPDPELWG